MTKNYKKWNIIAGTSIGAILLVSVLALGVLTPQAEAGLANGNGNGVIIGTPCDIVEHWDKIIFIIDEDESDVIPEELLETELDIKVRDDPGTVSDIKGKVRAFLEDGFLVDPTGDFIVLTPEEVAELELEIVDVEYAIVCIGIADA